MRLLIEFILAIAAWGALLEAAARYDIWLSGE